MQKNTPSLRRPKSNETKKYQSNEENFISKGLDNITENKSKNFSTTLSEQENSIIDMVIKAINSDIKKQGMKASKRSIVRSWIVERAKEEAKKRGLI